MDIPIKPKEQKPTDPSQTKQASVMAYQADHHGESSKLGNGAKPNIGEKREGKINEVSLSPEELLIHTDHG